MIILKKNETDVLSLLETVLKRCKEQSAFYRKIAYNQEYRDETIKRIVDLAIAYDDVSSYLENVFMAELERQSAVAAATVGDPVINGASDCKSLPQNESNEQERTASHDVNSVDINDSK